MEKDIDQSETGLGMPSPNGFGNSQPDENNQVKPNFSRQSNKGKPRFSPLRWLLWSTAFFLTATVSATLGVMAVLFTPLGSLLIPQHQGQLQKGSWDYGFQYRLSRPVNILVMGIDRVPDVANNSPQIFNGRSDTMLLLRLDPKEHSVKMLSVPRDSRVEFAGLKIPKINQANVEGGAVLAAQVLSRTLNNVQIDRYVRISTGAFRELVDQVGGIEVFVPHPMNYVDNTQNLKIDLQQGWQTLNGEQAEQFARFRNDNYGDIGRVQRQQALLKSLRQRLITPAVLPRLTQIVQVMWKYVDTNLSLEETLALVNFGLNLKSDSIKMVMLPGRFSTPKEYAASYWVIDSAAKDRIMWEFFQQEPLKRETTIAAAPAINKIKIAIQNATQQPELSRNIANYLLQKGFENVYIIDDWSDVERQTEIIVQQGDIEAANTMKKILGLGKIESTSVGDINSDLTIRVGADWVPK